MSGSPKCELNHTALIFSSFGFLTSFVGFDGLYLVIGLQRKYCVQLGYIFEFLQDYLVASVFLNNNGVVQVQLKIVYSSSKHFDRYYN